MAYGRILTMRRYSPAACRANKDRLFIFGDNMIGLGMGGQAVIRREPNAIGIPTKWRPGRSEGDYFTDADLSIGDVKHAILGALAHIEKHLRAGGDVIWPADGVGTGLAELPTRAPAILEFINRGIERLKDPTHD